jgi:hypothetical protein
MEGARCVHWGNEKQVQNFITSRAQYSKDLEVDDTIILKWITGEWNFRVRIIFILLRIWTRRGRCGHSNKPSGSRKTGNFLTERSVRYPRTTSFHGVIKYLVLNRKLQWFFGLTVRL